MPALINNLADAIVSEIKSRDWGREFSVERVYRPISKLKELIDMRVSVMPAKADATITARHSDEYELEIDIGIQQGRIDPADRDTLDALLEFVESMAAWFRGKTLTSWPRATIVDSNVSILWLPEHLVKYRIFTSVITTKSKLTVSNQRE